MEALNGLAKGTAASGVQIRHTPRLHAKILATKERAVITWTSHTVQACEMLPA